jgi:aspartate/methionine/tyrosine aminotransferase
LKELSFITDRFTESVIREMTRISDSIGGINLSQGFPDFDSPEELKKAAIAAINNNLNQYPVTFGEPELREAISVKVKWFNKIKCNPETDITVTCGATEAMISALKAIINPGDEIIIFEPFYENYGPDVLLSGALPKYVGLKSPDWKYDLDELKRNFNGNTKAIIINTPNNPTGKVFSKDELSDIADLCIKWDVIAITDEIYEHIVYDGNEHISIASLPGMAERSITINSLSKTYSVTGWRIGWAISSPLITSKIRKVHDFLTVGAPTPFQHAGIVGLNLPMEYYMSLQKRYLISRELLFTSLVDAGFKVTIPEGAYYFLADYTSFKASFESKNDLDFSVKFLQKTGIASVPGSSFYSSPQRTDLIRFAFCKRTETLKNASKILLNLKK